MFSRASDFERAQAITIGSILTEQTIPPLFRERIREDHFGGSDWGKMFSALLAVFEKTGEVAYQDAMKALEEIGINGIEAFERIHAAEELSYGYRVTEWPVRTMLAEAERNGLIGLIGTAEQKLLGGVDSGDVAVELQRGISRTCEDPGKAFDSFEAASIVLDYQEARTNGTEASTHIMTGFPTLDEEMRGLAPGEITLISGPTGHGKTSIAVNWLHQISMVDQIPSLFISLEMSVQGIMDRFLARLTGYTLGTVWDGKADSRAVTEATKRIHDSGMTITDNRSRTITQVLAVIERESLIRGTKVFVLDYIAEIVPDRKKKDDERNDQMYSRWVRALRHCCVEHGLHGIILCQNNKEGDLAESKSMSHVADAWYHFWRKDKGRGHSLMVRKARRGPVWQTYGIHFDPAHQIMRETGREESQP